MDTKFDELFKRIKRESFMATNYTKRVHSAIFDSKNTIAAIGYMNLACSCISTAKALYFSNYELLEHGDIEGFFNQFETFCDETVSNIAENHSHQWTDIEFNKLQELFDNSVLSQ